MKEIIFVYGSLRKGFYNYKSCGLDKAKFLGEGFISGFKMFSLGSYPCVVKSNDDNDVIFGEIYEVDDVTKIRNMELGAGYFEEEIIINGIKAKIYVFNENKLHKKILVEGGIWKKE